MKTFLLCAISPAHNSEFSTSKLCNICINKHCFTVVRAWSTHFASPLFLFSLFSSLSCKLAFFSLSLLFSLLYIVCSLLLSLSLSSSPLSLSRSLALSLSLCRSNKILKPCISVRKCKSDGLCEPVSFIFHENQFAAVDPSLSLPACLRLSTSFLSLSLCFSLLTFFPFFAVQILTTLFHYYSELG